MLFWVQYEVIGSETGNTFAYKQENHKKYVVFPV